MIIALLVRYFRFILRLYYSNIRIEGGHQLNPNKRQIIVSNHQNSLIDGLIFLTLIDSNVILTTTSIVGKFPLMSRLLKKANVQIFYRRIHGHAEEVMKRNQSTLERCAELLYEKERILIFPEGLTTTDGTILPFKTGFARIIQEYLETYGEEIEILPVHINYENRSKVRSNVHITILEPYLIGPERKDEETLIEALTDEVRQIIVDYHEGLNAIRDRDLPSRKLLDYLFGLPFLAFYIFPSALVVAISNRLKDTDETHATIRVFLAVVLFPLVIFFQLVFLISALPVFWLLFVTVYLVVSSYQFFKTIPLKIRPAD